MDYSKTKIYKIWSPLGDKIYIGATTKKYLSERLVKHRQDYRKWKEEKRGYTTSFILFDEYGVENCNIELIEAKECSDKDEQKKIEGFYIRSLVCVNKVIPDRTNKEYQKMYNPLYREKNKEALQKKDREYHHEHKEKRNAYNKEYYKKIERRLLKKMANMQN